MSFSCRVGVHLASVERERFGRGGSIVRGRAARTSTIHSSRIPTSNSAKCSRFFPRIARGSQVVDLKGRRVAKPLRSAGPSPYQLLLDEHRILADPRFVRYERFIFHPYSDLVAGRVDAFLLDNIIADRRFGAPADSSSPNLGDRPSVVCFSPKSSAALRDSANAICAIACARMRSRRHSAGWGGGTSTTGAFQTWHWPQRPRKRLTASSGPANSSKRRRVPPRTHACSGRHTCACCRSFRWHSRCGVGRGRRGGPM